jgi:hypothetical protein
MVRAKIKPKNNMIKSLIISIMLLGCSSSSIELEDVVGVYVCNHKYAADTLFVLPDSSYVHKVQLDTGVVIDNGCWKMDEGKMYFQGFMFYIPEYGPSIRGTWVTRIEYGENKELRFNLSSEQKEFYEKVYPIPPLFVIPNDTIQ